MRKIKLIIASLSVFAMLTACGEGFKAKKITSLGSGNQEQVVNNGKNEVVKGDTPVSVDQAILNSFSSELNNISQSVMDSFGTSINAFRLDAVTTVSPGAGTQTSTMTATMMTGCKDSDRIVITGVDIDMTKLTSGERVSLGRSGSYSLSLQCTDSTCNEMVAIIRNQGPNGVSVLAFIGLKKISSSDNNNVSSSVYESRLVEIDGFYTTLDTPFYTDICVQVNAFNDADLGADPFGPSTSGTGTVTDPTGGSFSPQFPDEETYNDPASTIPFQDPNTGSWYL